jgi:hypothetical protein
MGRAMKALKGKILHRLELHESSSICHNARKRQRNVRDEDEGNDGIKLACAKFHRASGLVFIPFAASQYPEFILSIPQNLQKLACHAAVFNQDVVIDRYVTFPISATDVPQHRTESFAFLEVHDMQLAGITSQDALLLEKDRYFLTLAQFRSKEGFEFEEMKTVQRSHRHQIVATVDAISPIITMDPSKPFALVELYDSESEEDSCVLVLKGSKALTCHSAIFPGDTIKFKGLCRKPWRVPQAFQDNDAFSHLSGRAPLYVFVADDLHCVSLAISHAVHSVPATPIPLVSIQGKIGHVETTTVKRKGKRSRTIEWLEVFPGTEVNKQCKLFVGHYPMAAALLLSIRSGAEIRAVNVHSIGRPARPNATNYECFGACLRSTITLVKHVQENGSCDDLSFVGSSEESLLLCTQPDCAPFQSTTISTLSIRDFVPFNFCKTRHSYGRNMYHDHVEGFLRHCFPKHAKSIPSTDRIVEGLDSEVDRMVRFTHTLGQCCRSISVGQEKPCDASAITTNKPQKQRALARDPYAEFFDHAADENHPELNSFDLKGCAMSRKEPIDRQPRPHLAGLHHLRSVVLQLLLDRIVARETCGDAGIPMGWNASIHLTDMDLLAAMGNQQDNASGCDSTILFSGGIVKQRKPGKSAPVSLSDKNCCMPVGFSQETRDFIGDFVIGRVLYVVTACICIATLSDESSEGRTQEDIREETFRPKCEVTSLLLSKTLEGACSVVRVGKKLFLSSVYICFEKAVPIQSPGDAERCVSVCKEKGPLGVTVKDCLASPRDGSESTASGSIIGLLLRKRFAYSKLQSNGMCKGCILTLSSVPFGKADSRSEASCLQSLEVKLSIPIGAGKIENFKRAISRLSPDISLSEEQLALAVSWWTLADSGTASPIVNGGWDDFVKGSRAEDVAVHVIFPMTALSAVKCGFVRVDCRLDEIEATYQDTRNGSGAKLGSFDFVSTGKALVTGMVCQRPLRRLVFGPDSPRLVGERMDNASTEVPTRSLAFLFRCLCVSLDDQDPTILSPELVVQVAGASFLGVTFCQVQCICTRCYKRLIPKTTAHMNAKIRMGVKTTNDEPSFWHLSNPDGPLAGNPLPVNKSTQRTPEASMPGCAMRCPSGCPSECFGLKWECSGTLDDGTGQARLFAERNAALTLLGMDARTIRLVEEGVWHVDGASICFSKSIPPTQRLQEHVKSAIAQGQRRGQDPLKYLTPASRAEYLLQHYCRNSKQRRLDYFVQCKPLAHEIQHLKHTMIEGYVPERANGSLCTADVATYALPPIKLRLVDCGVPTDDSMNIYAKNLKESEP